MQNKSITTEEALAWGLVDKIVDCEQIQPEALRVAEDIASKKQGSIHHTKRLLLDDQSNLAQRLEEERRRFVKQIVTVEAQAGMAAFLDRRQA